MSFMEYPQPDACRALMPTPEPAPPGPPSRPMVCHMPKGHDGPHAITRRPRSLDRRWEGDARPAPAPARYAQCDETCTVDCGHCKGAGPPAPVAAEGSREVMDLTRRTEQLWSDLVNEDDEGAVGILRPYVAAMDEAADRMDSRVAAEGTDELRDTAPAQPGNDQLYLDSIRTEGGETVITAHGAEQTLALMALSMRAFFEANSGDDTNYVQSGVLHEGKTWNFVVYPAGKPTPHDLRRRAEAERDALLAKVQAVEALADEMLPPQPGDHPLVTAYGNRIRRALGGESR